MEQKKSTTIFLWAMKLLAAAIMLMTLYYKFSAAEESVYIFTTLGLEPYGRIGIGVLELIASALILIPRTTAFGAVLGLGLMSGALFSHITKLGIVVKDDGGQLFIYALLVFIACAVLAFFYRDQLLNLIRKNKQALTVK